MNIEPTPPINTEYTMKNGLGMPGEDMSKEILADEIKGQMILSDIGAPKQKRKYVRKANPKNVAEKIVETYEKLEKPMKTVEKVLNPLETERKPVIFINLDRYGKARRMGIVRKTQKNLYGLCFSL